MPHSPSSTSLERWVYRHRRPLQGVALVGTALSVLVGLWLLATVGALLALGCLVAVAGFGAMLWSLYTLSEPGPPRGQGRRRRRD